MKGYRKPSGVYLEIGDAVPVSNSLVMVALRPSVEHTFADAWQTDPMNPTVCWRLKTQAELDADKDNECQLSYDQIKILKAFVRSLLPVINNLRQNPTTTYPAITEQQAYDALKNEYRRL